MDDMTISVIDIGTNTMLMVTGTLEHGSSIRVLGDENLIARLGRGVDATRMISDETLERVVGILEHYREISRSLGAGRIVAFGTSALRDARNRAEFIGTVEARTGIPIDLLSGDDEAELTYRGAMFGLPGVTGERAVIDIGGGSTEIAHGTGEVLHEAVSLDVGAVRLTERFFTGLPPGESAIERARSFTRQMLETSVELPKGVTVVGVAGTVTTLGALDAAIEQFDAEALNGHQLSADAISSWTSRLASMSVDQIASLPHVPRQRADVLLGGAIVLDEFMRHYGLQKITVSTRGLRYGVLLREFAGADGTGGR